MTHEEKLRALLPKEREHHSIKCECRECRNADIYNQAIYRCIEALKDKVILREELLTKKEIQSLSVQDYNFGGIAERIVYAQSKKAGLV